MGKIVFVTVTMQLQKYLDAKHEEKPDIRALVPQITPADCNCSVGEISKYLHCGRDDFAYAASRKH